MTMHWFLTDIGWLLAAVAVLGIGRAARNIVEQGVVMIALERKSAVNIVTDGAADRAFRAVGVRPPALAEKLPTQ